MKNRLNLSGFALALCLFFSLMEVNGQVLSEPSFFSTFDDEEVTRLCADQDTSQRYAIVNYSGPGLFFGPGTEFILELSDPNGVFSDEAIILSSFISPTAFGGLAEIELPPFSIPTGLAGENYSARIRVPRENDTDFISDINENIPGYFVQTNTFLDINGSNTDVEGISNIGLCNGELVTLQVIPNDFTSYIWRFNGVIIPGETTAVLEDASEFGTYQVLAELGSCDGVIPFNTSATIEIVDFSENSNNIFIENASPAEFCPSDLKQLTVNVTGFAYEWFKDGILIPESNSNPLELPQSNFGGMYSVRVIASEDCSVTTEAIEVINLGSDILTQPPPQLMLLPGEPDIELAITTNAPIGSTVQWFKDNIPFTVPLPVANPGVLSILVNTVGVYRVEVDTSPSADICKDVLDAQTEVFVPVGFRTAIASVIDCDDNLGTIGLENLFGIAANGTEVPLTEEQYSFFDFEWFQDNISNANTTITQTISESDINNTFALESEFRSGGFPIARSNDFVVEFLSNEVALTASSPFVDEGESVTLTAPENARYTYEWFQVVDGENQVITGALTNTLVISENGLYFVRITLEECIIDSSTINISEAVGQSDIIPNVITPNGDNINDTWSLPASLVNQQDVEVTIYRRTGQVDFSGSSYQNDWPRENSSSSGEDQIYYYIIARNNAVVRKGSITVMR